MGKIKKILSEKQLPERELHNSRLFIDLSENIHIHFREMRLMFGVEEFFEFCSILHEGARDIRKYLRKHPEYKEQDIFDGILIAGGAQRQLLPLRKSPRPHVSKYFPNRLQIELQDEHVIDAIHIHYRDYRLVMNIDTFREFGGGIKEALDRMDEFLETQGFQQSEHPFRQVVAEEDWARKKTRFWDKMKLRMKRFFE